MKKFSLGLVILMLGEISLADEEHSWADSLATEIVAPFDSPEHRDFDFWIGEWEMNWRPAVQGQFRHQAEGSWTRQRVFPILGGKALVELAWARDNPNEPSQRGFSIRYFDAERDRWIMAQNWPNATNNGAAFIDQLMGDKHHGRLTMYSAQRRPGPDGEIRTEHRRYNFSDIQEGTSFRWDGSNSPDLGYTWHTWYVVDAHRKRDLDTFQLAGTAFPGVHQSALCTAEPHGELSSLQGRWRGTVSAPDGNTADASLDFGVLLDGCAIAGILRGGGDRTFLAIGYFDRENVWVTYRLSDVPGETHGYLVADNAGDITTFTEAPELAINDEMAVFGAPENFSTSDALRRTVWTQASEKQLLIRDETRADTESPWQTANTFDLRR